MHERIQEEKKSNPDEISNTIEKLSQKMNRGYFKHKEPKTDSGFSKSVTSICRRKIGNRRLVLT